ncbi:unnamed protein product, partial [Amoebophrya sp. A25]
RNLARKASQVSSSQSSDSNSSEEDDVFPTDDFYVDKMKTAPANMMKHGNVFPGRKRSLSISIFPSSMG